jgi:O-antigen/teichoic acid export membrane protein
LFAGSNFATNVLLARWLLPVEYGAFTVAFTVFLFVGTFHTALLTEPMLVFGADGRFKDRFGHYIGALLFGHLAVCAVASLILVLGAGLLQLFGQADVATALGSLALAQPFILLPWLLRRACYVRADPKTAAMAGFGYLIVTLCGLGLIHSAQLVSVPAALVVMAAASLASAAWLAHKLTVRLPNGGEPKIIREAAANHWRYAKWALATAIVGFVPGNIYFLMLPSVGGLEQSGALRALMNLVMPLLQANAAICTLLLPSFVNARLSGSAAPLRSALLVLVGGPMVYWLVLGILHRPAMQIVYGGRFLELSSLLWTVGLLPVITGVVGVLGAAVRALERPDAVFRATVVSALASLSIGLLLMFKLGLAGVVLALLLCLSVQSLSLGLELGRLNRSTTAPRVIH